MHDEGNLSRDEADWIPWAIFIGPLAAYMLIEIAIISIWERIDVQLDPYQSANAILAVAITRTLLLTGLMAWAIPRVLKTFEFKVSPIAFAIGMLGGVVWIALCNLNVESIALEILGLPSDFLGSRAAVNPWELFDTDSSLHAFLITRFSLLVLAVPIAEELFLRGFLIRYAESPTWETLRLKDIGIAGFLTAVAYGVLTHPAEWLAAAVWFSLITIMMMRTKRFWDCVIAHSITNLILGIYVIALQDWRLW